jgi:hypothetical protein
MPNPRARAHIRKCLEMQLLAGRMRGAQEGFAVIGCVNFAVSGSFYSARRAERVILARAGASGTHSFSSSIHISTCACAECAGCAQISPAFLGPSLKAALDADADWIGLKVSAGTVELLMGRPRLLRVDYLESTWTMRRSGKAPSQESGTLSKMRRNSRWSPGLSGAAETGSVST